MLQEEKTVLRRRILRSLRSLSAEERDRKSASVVQGTLALPEWRDAAWVLAFFPLAEEATVTPLLERAIDSKSLYLPRVEGDALVFHRVPDLDQGLLRHPYGMLEPDGSLPLLDVSSAPGSVLVLTPGIAFDSQGGRLGRGRGYYDRFLAGLRSACRPLAVGLGFSEQLVSRVPMGEGDQRVDAVITDRGVQYV